MTKQVLVTNEWREISTTLRSERRAYFKAKLAEKNEPTGRIRVLKIHIKAQMNLRKGTIVNVMKDKNEDLLSDSHPILNTLKDYLN